MFDGDIRSREKLGLVAVFPSDTEGGRSVLAEDLQNLSVAIGLAQVMPFDHEAIAGAGAYVRVVR